MPWKDTTTMELRYEFVTLASHPAANIRALCRRYGISPTTGYTWLQRYRDGGPDALADQSRRPHASPLRTPPAIEARILALRASHPAWGGRKLRAWLLQHPSPELPASAIPSPSTITAILRRHEQLDPIRSAAATPLRRFEQPFPNALWQLDFLGHRPLGRTRVHPLGVLDDHSRFCLGLFAGADETAATVQTHLTSCFRRYGLPTALLCDNGAPWASPGNVGRLTRLEVWLLRLEVALWHGRVFHPQTQGKVERFHATVIAEALGGRPYPDLAACQRGFDAWRQVYNYERPHEALADAVPASRYTPSGRSFPEVLPPLEYPTGMAVRAVSTHGQISYERRVYFIGEGLAGERVGLEPTAEDGVMRLLLGVQRIGVLDLRTGELIR